MLVAALLSIAAGIAMGDPVRIKGVIDGRSGSTMTVKSPDAGTVTVVLTAATRVDEMEAILVTGRLAPTALVPGLKVTVEGSFDANKQLAADKVLFQASDLQTAQDIQAGLAPVQQQLAAQQKEIQAQQAVSASHQAEIDANRKAIEAANKRFGELGDYNILGEVTVLFGNGQTAIEP